MRAISVCAENWHSALLMGPWLWVMESLKSKFFFQSFHNKNRVPLWAQKLWYLYAIAGLAVLGAQAQQITSTEPGVGLSKVGAPGEASLAQATPLSAWLLNQPSWDGAYPLGLVWATPEEQTLQSAQQRAWLTQLERLRTDGRISAQTWLSMQRMMRTFGPTGRVRLAAADAQWLLANPRRDALVLPTDTLRLPMRPQTIRLLDELGRACDVAHRPGALGRDYLSACWPDHRAERAWLVQPDGRIQHLGLRPWNPQAQDEPAPGAWLWVPSDGAGLPVEINQAWAQWLSHQGVSGQMLEEGFTSIERKPAPPSPGLRQWDVAGQQFEPQASASNWGMVGLLQTPTARMRSAGHFGLNFVRLSPLNFVNVIFQPLDGVEGGFRYIDVENRLYGPQAFSGDLPYKDKSFDLKLRAWRESDALPELSVGWRDFGGTGLYSSEYVVANKRWGRLDASLGMGWGYLGNRGDVRNPLSSLLGSKMDLRQINVGEGGNFSTETWFRGDAAWFGGLEYQSPWKTVFKLEYDGNHYQREPQDNNLPQKTPLNVGLVYRPTAGLDVSLGYERGTTWSLGLTFYTDLSGLAVPKVTAPPVPAVRLQRPQAEPDWQATARDMDSLTLWRTRQIYRQDQTVVVEAADTHHPYTSDRLEKALSVLQRDAPAEVERFEIHHHAVGDVLAVEKVDRETWARAKTSAPRVNQPVLVQGPIYEKQGTSGQPLFNRPPSFFQLEPGFDYLPLLGGPNGYLYQLRLTAVAKANLPWNTKLRGTAAHRVVDNYDQFITLGWSTTTARVRTYLREYLITARTTLDNLSIDKSERLSRSWYASAYAGYFETMYGGVGSELLYRQPGSSWGLGVDVNRVQARNFEQDFGFRPNQTHDTGHVTAYWTTPFQGIQTSLSVGQYLAGDVGATWSVAKTFANGATMGAFVTKTKMSAQEFGEGSFDKGIYWNIPLEAFLTSPSRFIASFSWKPLTRDGGAMVARPVNLYAQSRWVGSDAKAYAPAPPWNETVPPDDRLEPWQRKR